MTSASTDWRPTASLEALRRRAGLLAATRAFMAQRGMLEVETPVVSLAGNTDPAIHSLTSQLTTSSGIKPGWLHTSPEFPMKRLLASGSGAIYQIARVFRDGESGRLHNPEFTLLEWYRPGFDLQQLMNEVADLVQTLLEQDLPVEFRSWREVMQEIRCSDLDTPATLELRAVELGLIEAGELQLEMTDQWLDLLFSLAIQPGLGRNRITFIHHYPASQAALARMDPEDSALSLRFELFVEGVELANGYDELRDAVELERRVQEECEVRRQQGMPQIAPDPHLLAAMQAGLPACSGVALGLDRLLMLAQQAEHIQQVIAFPADRA